jgi:hypothetical protein
LSKQFNYSFGINYSLYASVGQGQHPKKYQNTLYANIKSTDIVPEFQYSRLTHDFKEIKTLPPATDVQLEGFFQSRKYFGSYDEEIRQLYKLPQEDIETAETFISKDTRPVVGVHVRLGDYSDHPGLQAFKKSYFSRAASKFSPDSRIVVCSDQPDLACKILTEEKSWFRRPIRPEIYPGTSELADLAFLSSCKQLILSNSTFSYWAYFLGKKKTRVIAPKRWFNRNVNTRNHDHIYEKDWELL